MIAPNGQENQSYSGLGKGIQRWELSHVALHASGGARKVDPTLNEIELEYLDVHRNYTLPTEGVFHSNQGEGDINVRFQTYYSGFGPTGLRCCAQSANI